MTVNLSTYHHVGVQEDTTNEFKTSLFFRPGISDPGEEQMDVITRTLASLINTDGGDLWVGVNDSGYASDSVIGELQYLNSFPAYPGNKYPLNQDGYKRFVCDWVARNLGTFAVSLLSFEFHTYGYVEVCKIHVRNSKAPVWFKGTGLFVRGDGTTRQLRGNDITSFMLNVDKTVFTTAQQASQAARDKQIAAIKAGKTQATGTILVVYPDGTFIHGKSNVAAMLEVIHRSGIENVINLSLAGRYGRSGTPYVPFIGREVYLTGPNKDNKSQRELDGYMVFVKYSVGEMVSKILQISSGLGLGLHVEIY